MCMIIRNYYFKMKIVVIVLLCFSVVIIIVFVCLSFKKYDIFKMLWSFFIIKLCKIKVYILML